MADAVIELQASNLFDLAANFKTQSSGTTAESTNLVVNDEFGNVDCEQNIADVISYTQSAQYCGTDFDGDLKDGRATPVSILANMGCTFGGKLLTSLTINMTAGEYCSIDLEGHNHDTSFATGNAHDGGTDPLVTDRTQALKLGLADFSTFFVAGAGLATWDGFGVPDFGVTTGSDSSPSSATMTLSLNHVDQIDEAGQHLVGKNITPRFELSVEFSGVPTSNTPALLEADFDTLLTPWTDVIVDSTDTNDTNSEFDSFSFTAHGPIDLETT
jgi:hypothetical protein